MGTRKNKLRSFKLQFIDLLDEFIIAVERANRAKTPIDEKITYTFENFMKWILFERNKKLEVELKEELSKTLKGAGRKKKSP